MRSFLRSRYPLAIGAGALLAASFPTVDAAGLAWIAPGLILAAALGKRGGESFRIGYLAGLVHYLLSLHWLLYIPDKWFPILGWVALGAFLSLFPGLWTWFLCTLSPAAETNSSDLRTDWLAAAERMAAATWLRRISWAGWCGVAWVAMEMILARVFGGFPWNLLGVSQHQILPLIQIAAFMGVYGVAFLVVWTSASLLCASLAVIRRPTPARPWMSDVILPFSVVAIVFVSGFHRIAQTPAALRELRVTLVQPSIPQTLIWNPDMDTDRFREMIQLTEAALTNQCDLLIWPESAIPKLIRYDMETFGAITNIAIQHHIWMIVGSDDAEPARGSSDPKAVEYSNSSFLISPRGELMARYRKRNLVIFGEYIPLARWLPFMKYLTPVQGSFTAGDRAVPFELSDLGVKTSVLICYEDVFATLGRESAGPDTDFLVNLTNDGWFGRGAAQWQQSATAMFRAVENGLPLVRCTNTGLTCWYDATGRLREYFTDADGAIYGRGYLSVGIPIREPGKMRTLTFYTRHGDWFGWGCVALTGMRVLVALVYRRMSKLPARPE